MFYLRLRRVLTTDVSDVGYVTTDVSDVGYGAYRTQQESGGGETVVVYRSRVHSVPPSERAQRWRRGALVRLGGGKVAPIRVGQPVPSTDRPPGTPNHLRTQGIEPVWTLDRPVGSMDHGAQFRPLKMFVHPGMCVLMV